MFFFLLIKQDTSVLGDFSFDPLHENENTTNDVR